jgi:methyl-accepting chemotaxis protein
LTNKSTLDALVPVKSVVTASAQDIEKLGEAGRSHLQAFTFEEQRAAQRRSQIVVGMTLATVMLLIVMVGRAVRRVVRPLSMAVATAKQVAGGQLAQTTKATTIDETGELINVQHEMVQSLRSIVTEVRSGSDAVALASGEIAAGASSLSERTTMQAGKLQDASHALATMAESVQSNADTSQSAAELSNSATAVAARGRIMVQAVVATMNQIQTSSQRIGDITGVIDAIAFQTNILALNAAVEAARAGDHGKGFAVVASEVRSLAHRASLAAREIKTLIAESAEQVRIGGAAVGQAGETITDVEAQVRGVSDMIGRIAEATRGQSGGLHDVNTAIREVGRITQQNAEMAKGSNAAALELQGHARDLAGVVAVFDL